VSWFLTWLGAARLQRILSTLAGKRDIAALRGWRREVFGSNAVDLIEGRLALSLAGDQAKLIPIAPPKATAAD